MKHGRSPYFWMALAGLGVSIYLGDIFGTVIWLVLTIWLSFEPSPDEPDDNDKPNIGGPLHGS